HTGQFQGCSGTNNGRDIRIVILVGGHNGTDDLYFVHEAFGEQRTDGTVDQTGSQGFLLGRTSLTAEVATGDTANRVAVVLVMNSQREEILARLGLFLGNDSGQYNRIVHGHHHRTASLTRDAPCFQSNVRLTELKRFSYRFHGNSFHDWVPLSTLNKTRIS